MTASHDEPDREEKDPWEAARERQRDQVQAIFAARSSAPQVERRRDFRPGRRGWTTIAAALLAVAVVTAVTVPSLRDSAAEQRRTDRARQLGLEARERTRLRIEVKPRFVPGPRRRAREAPLAYRARVVTAGEAAVAADARARIEAGMLEGSVAGTECSPYPEGPTRLALEADRTVPRGRYECIAYARRFPLSELGGRKRTGIIGVPYWLVADYGSGRLAFCKITPKAGEGGRSLATVPVPPPCRDPLRMG